MTLVQKVKVSLNGAASRFLNQTGITFEPTTLDPKTPKAHGIADSITRPIDEASIVNDTAHCHLLIVVPFTF
jgi:hypothetical protein